MTDLLKINLGGQLYNLGVQNDATTTQKGLMTAEQVVALNSAQANVLEGVKVNGAALVIADKIVDILIAEGTENGTISVNNVNVAVKGLQKLAFKEEISESELSAALAAVIAAKAEASDLTALQGVVNGHTSELSTLKGSGEGSISKAIADAIDDFATKISDNGSVDTFKELVDYVAQHGTDVTGMLDRISANETGISNLVALVGTLPETATSQDVVSYIAEYVTAAIDGKADKSYVDTELDKKVDQSAYDTKVAALETSIALKADATATTAALENKVDKVEGMGLSHNDYSTAEKTKLAGIVEGANKFTMTVDGDTIVCTEAHVEA